MEIMEIHNVVISIISIISSEFIFHNILEQSAETSVVKSYI